MSKQRARAKLFLVGVGPGDPDLVTIKAINIVRESDVLFVPVGKAGTEESIAREIISVHVDLSKKHVVALNFPMVRGSRNIAEKIEPAAATVVREVRTHGTGALITIGCPTIYSTACNLARLLDGIDIAVEIVPGVSSINAAAASTGRAIVYSEDKLAVIPAVYAIDDAEFFIARFETVVMMKIHSSLPTIMKLLSRHDLLESSFLVENASARHQKITPLADLPTNYAAGYMSTIIVHTKREA